MGKENKFGQMVEFNFIIKGPIMRENLKMIKPMDKEN